VRFVITRKLIELFDTKASFILMFFKENKANKQIWVRFK